MEMLALANIHSERRPESTPIEQARGMLADFIRAAQQPKSETTVAPDGEWRDATTATTLGDLLYADKAKACASEKDWVALVESIAAGDQLALHRLFERTQHIVFTLIVRLTNNRETAEELTLHVFQQVWRRAPKYDAAAGSVLGWIMNHARSVAMDHLGAQPQLRGSLPINAVFGTEPARDVIAQGNLLQDALMVLTPDERQMIETVFLSELGYADVAAELQQPLRSVRTRIHCGLEKLRRALAKGVKQQ
jgi:RNA polymerase sigma-70 factor (ECF subfamily)